MRSSGVVMGTGQRRKREAAQRRQDILDAGRRVFWKLDYKNATIPKIAAEAELAPGTLYLYFPSKAAIYAELLLEGYDKLLAHLQSVTSGEVSDREAAERLIDAFLGFARDYPEYFEIIFFIRQSTTEENWDAILGPGQVEKLHEGEVACRGVVAEVLNRIGYGNPDSREADVCAVWSMLAGVIFFFRNDENYDAISKKAKQLLLTAVFSG